MDSRIGITIVIGAAGMALPALGAIPFEESASVFGVRVGVGYNVPNRMIDNPPEDYYSIGLALSAGMAYDYQFAAPFYLHTGLTLNYDTYGMYDSRHKHCPVRKLGCTIPVGIGVSIPIRKVNLQLVAGPSLAIGLGGWVRGNDAPLHAEQRWEDYYSLTGTPRCDLLLDASGGVTYGDWYFGVHPTIGLIHRYDLSHTGYHDLSLRLIIGRNF